MALIGNPISTVAFLTDTFSGGGGVTTFTMSVAPAGTASILVAITGVVQAPSTYSVIGTTLTFSSAPPSGTNNISVRYLGIPASGVTTTAYRNLNDFTATAGQTSFTPSSYTPGYINVYRNGVRLGSADYTATNGTTVVLAVAANLNDLVTVESFYVSSVLNALPATGGTINGNLTVSGSIISNINTVGNVNVTGNVNNTGNITVTNGAVTARINPRTTILTAPATITPDVSVYDQITGNALSQTVTINAPIGNPVDGQKLMLRFLDNGTSRTLTWNGTYTVIGATLPTATTVNKTTYVGCIYNSIFARWDVVAAVTQA